MRRLQVSSSPFRRSCPAGPIFVVRHRARKVKCNQLPGQDKVRATRRRYALPFLTFVHTVSGKLVDHRVPLLPAHRLPLTIALSFQELSLHVSGVSKFYAMCIRLMRPLPDTTSSRLPLKRNAMPQQPRGRGRCLRAAQGGYACIDLGDGVPHVTATASHRVHDCKLLPSSFNGIAADATLMIQRSRGAHGHIRTFRNCTCISVFWVALPTTRPCSICPPNHDRYPDTRSIGIHILAAGSKVCSAWP